MADYDANIAAIARSRPLRTIDDVLAVMHALDAALLDKDGVKWFNVLYLRVTESVRNEPPAGGWNDPQWLERLDVVFAGLYFDALASLKNAPRSWRALFNARWSPDIARVQFALAGMNAHINHDLALALLQTGQERNGMPDHGSPQHRDYERVNALLERVEGEVKTTLLSRIAGQVDRHFGRVDDVIAMWKVRKARDTAWLNGEVLWELRRISIASRQFVQSLDRLVGLSGKGLLVPTRIA
jgi:Family of unknown function (DUF5995)